MRKPFMVSLYSLFIFVLLMASRRIWTQREDQIFMRIADQYEPKNWAVIAKRMASEFGFKKRTGKQCRQRWFNHLDPTICKKGWTKEEEENLMQLHKTYGNKWTLIAEKMPGRSDNSIKNYFYSTVRRNLRRMGKLLGSKNSTGLMRQIKPSTMTKVFGSLNEEEDHKLSHYLEREGFTRNFMRESCESIRNEIIQFSYYKPKKNDRIEHEEKQKFERVFWLLQKVNEIYEKVRQDQKSNRTEKQLFRSYYQEMNRSESEEQEESQSDVDQADQSSESRRSSKGTPTPSTRNTRTRNMHSPITVNVIEVTRVPEVQIQTIQKEVDQNAEAHLESQSFQRPNQESTLENIVEYAEQFQFNDPQFNIELNDDLEKPSMQLNGLEIHMSNMSFRSPACSFGTPISQVNFFKSPRSIKITCLNDYLMKLSSSYGKDENEMGLSGSGKMEQRPSMDNNFFGQHK